LVSICLRKRHERDVSAQVPNRINETNPLEERKKTFARREPDKTPKESLKRRGDNFGGGQSISEI